MLFGNWMTLNSKIRGQEVTFGSKSLRADVQGAAAGASAGAEVQKELEVGLWIDLYLGHDLDPDQLHQSNLPGQGQDRNHDHGLHLHPRCRLVVVDILATAGFSGAIVLFCALLEFISVGFHCLMENLNVPELFLGYLLSVWRFSWD